MLAERRRERERGGKEGGREKEREGTQEQNTLLTYSTRGKRKGRRRGRKDIGGGIKLSTLQGNIKACVDFTWFNLLETSNKLFCPTRLGTSATATPLSTIM